jgi:hypothetical protein
MAWADGLDDSGRALAIASIAAGRALEAPVEAAKLVSRLPAGQLQNEAAVTVAANWALHEPHAAAAWALDFPDPVLRDQAIRQVVSSWATGDVLGLVDWTKQLPSGATRDSIIAAVVDQTASILPETATRLIGLVADRTRQVEIAAAAQRAPQADLATGAP